MAYEGYRVKVNNIIIPDNMIAKGTYSFQSTSRVVDSYYDAMGVLHEERSPHTRAVIKFSIREHASDEHDNMMAAFMVKENVTVEFWDDETSTYKSATCKINDLSMAHLNTNGGRINYAQTAITIEEY